MNDLTSTAAAGLDRSRRRVLICTNHLRDYAGSEVVVLELVEQFLTWDWMVDVYTNDLGSPALDDLLVLPNWGRLRVVVASPEEAFDASYDLIWIQHGVLPPSFISTLSEGTSAPIVWHHLSSFLPVEMPILADIENRLVSVSSGMSPTVIDVLRRFGIDQRHLMLFDNPAPDAFCDADIGERSTSLERVLVVSNHAPSVVRESASVLQQHGVHVDFLGVPDGPERVTPELLARYSAVITIGKTVQYALTMGIPVFVLDHFGGCGWLSNENFERELQVNFSGRASRADWSVDEVVRAIREDFGRARAWSASRRADAIARWRLSSRLEALLADRRIVKRRKRRLTEADVLRYRAAQQLYGDMYRLVIHLQNQAVDSDEEYS